MHSDDYKQKLKQQQKSKSKIFIYFKANSPHVQENLIFNIERNSEIQRKAGEKMFYFTTEHFISLYLRWFKQSFVSNMATLKMMLEYE